MTDRYIAFANSPSAAACWRRRPSSPLRLERWQAGRVRPVDGPLVIGGSGALAEAVLPFAGKLTDAVFAAVEDSSSCRAGPPNTARGPRRCCSMPAA